MSFFSVSLNIVSSEWLQKVILCVAFFLLLIDSARVSSHGCCHACFMLCRLCSRSCGSSVKASSTWNQSHQPLHWNLLPIRSCLSFVICWWFYRKHPSLFALPRFLLHSTEWLLCFGILCRILPWWFYYWVLHTPSDTYQLLWRALTLLPLCVGHGRSCVQLVLLSLCSAKLYFSISTICVALFKHSSVLVASLGVKSEVGCTTSWQRSACSIMFVQQQHFLTSGLGVISSLWFL